MMNIYKKAAKKCLRFATTRGSLNVEQLFNLTQKDLEITVKNLQRCIKLDASEDNLLRLEIINDILNTKDEENE